MGAACPICWRHALRWKLEYLYLNLGTLDVATSLNATGGTTTHIEFTDNIVRVGLELSIPLTVRIALQITVTTLSLLFLTISAAAAYAHASLAHASPSVGSIVSVAPHEVILTFTERLEAAFRNLQGE